MKKGYLTVEHLGKFEGELIGIEKGVSGELVFTTSPSGYLKSLTDPSYRGQILIFSFPYIGAYGTEEIGESGAPQVRGVIVNNIPQMFKSKLSSYLESFNIPGIIIENTRDIVDFLRMNGNRNGAIGKVNTIKDPYSINLVKDVVSKGRRIEKPNSKKIGIVDLGLKGNILENLHEYDLTVIPYPEFQTLRLNEFDGFILSNGPGDPSHPDLEGFRNTLKEVIGKKPVLGICLGHQLIALSIGLKTEKMKFGHRSINHPVKDLYTGKLGITTHNHGFTVRFAEDHGVKERFVSLNDGSNEGLEGKNLISVQFHPEGGPGPVDELSIFDEFRRMVYHV